MLAVQDREACPLPAVAVRPVGTAVVVASLSLTVLLLWVVEATLPLASKMALEAGFTVRVSPPDAAVEKLIPKV